MKFISDFFQNSFLKYKRSFRLGTNKVHFLEYKKPFNGEAFYFSSSASYYKGKRNVLRII